MEKTMILDIEGMSCAHCVKHVETALNDLAGVASVKADLAAGTAVVRFDDGVTGLEAFCSAVEDAGYTAKERP